MPDARKNRSHHAAKATAATLVPVDPKTIKVPRLPARMDELEWVPDVKAWWKRAWQSPMRAQWMDSDVDTLLLIADLRQRYALTPIDRNTMATNLAAEIRLQQQNLGLSPLDRRRLEWATGQVEDADDKRRTRPQPRLDAQATVDASAARADPRLRVV